VTSGGAITQGGAAPITCTGTGSFTATAGAITLTNAANSFGTFNASTSNANVNVRDNVNGIILGTLSTGSGTLTVYTPNGGITQIADVVVGGTTTLTAKNTENIVLDRAGNNFATVGITSARNATITDSNAIALGAGTSVAGFLNITASGAITGVDVFVGDTTTLNSGTGDITLTNAANDFTNAVSITSFGNVNIKDTAGIAFNASTVKNLTISSNAITLVANSNINTTEILSDGASFDCQGYSITGNGSGYGIYLSGRTGVSVKNCVMVSHGMEFNSNGSVSTTVTNMTLNSSGLPATVNFSYSGDIMVGSAAAQADSGLMNVSKYLTVSSTTAAWVYVNVSYASDTNENNLRMYRWTGSGWTLVSGTNGVNTTDNFVYANLTSFSIFAPMADVTAPIVSLSTPVEGANVSTASPSFIFNFTDNFSATAACTLNVDGVAAAAENSTTLNDTMTTSSARSRQVCTSGMSPAWIT